MLRNIGNKFFGEFQRIGASLMLPIALLPAAGLMMGIGFALTNATLVDLAPWLTGDFWVGLANLFQSASSVIFGNLPIIFAVGVALGLSENDGVAALAALVCFLITNITIKFILGITPEVIAADPYNFTMNLGIETLQYGPFGGIIIGYAASKIYNRFHKTTLPQYLAFFEGKRLVPIMSSLAGLFLGILFAYIWPIIQNVLNSTAGNLLDSTNPNLFALFIYGFLIHFLVIFGLHHLVYPVYYYQIGTYITKAGETVTGDLSIYFAQLQDGVTPTSGLFAIGAFPLCLFILPAVAYAIYKCAKPENRPKISGFLIASAVTAFITGVTEPLEFSFAFIAFPIWIFINILHGLVFVLAAVLGIRAGTTFTGGLIDFILSTVLPGAPRWPLLLLIGAILGVVAYFGTKWLILKFNYKTLGREDEEMEEIESSSKDAGADLPYKVLKALGGNQNISKVDACITRLRLTVDDTSVIEKETLKQLGAVDVLFFGNNVQAIFGRQAQILRDQIRDIRSGKTPSQPINENDPLDLKEKEINEKIVAPMSGKLISLDLVKDKTFSSKLVGEGFAIEIADKKVVAPTDGTIESVFETKHAITMISDEGVEILIHIGLDTVGLKGEPFTSLVNSGDKVVRGQQILEVDVDMIKQKHLSLQSPVIFTNVPKVEVEKKQLNTFINSGKEINFKGK